MKEFYISSNKYSLRERPTKRGKVYDVIFRVITKDGIEKQKSLCGYQNKTLAKQGYLDFVSNNCELYKRNPLKKIKPDKDDPTVSELSAQYFLSVRNQIKDSTLYEKQKLFDLIIIPYFGKMKLKDISSQALYRWQDELWASRNPKTGDYYAYKYLSKIRTYFSAFLTWCGDRFEGFVNYLPQIKKPKRRQPKTEMQFWTKSEFETFISVVDNKTYHCLFSMLFYTGRRKGEILALSPGDVKTDYIIFNKSLTRKTLTDDSYEITSTKTEKNGKTPICKPLKKELENYSEPEGRFFFGGTTPITDNTLRRAFNKYAEVAGVKQIRIHDLRHSFVSMLIHLGANLTVIADLIGDTLAQVTKTYAHLYEEDKKNIIAKIV